MKLKCKKMVKRHFYRNEDGEEQVLLTKGREYVVLGISFSTKSRYVCLETNDELPALLDIRQFEIISNYVPSRWTVRYLLDVDHLSFFPQSWVDSKSFWSSLFQKQKVEMLNLYRWERDLIFAEEPR